MESTTPAKRGTTSTQRVNPANQLCVAGAQSLQPKSKVWSPRIDCKLTWWNNLFFSFEKHKLGRKSSKPKKASVIPVNFLLKYEPPKIGVKYIDKQNPGKCKVKQITLAHLRKEGVDPDRVVQDLFKCHPKYFNSQHIKREQVRELVDKLIEYHRALRRDQQSHSVLDAKTQNGDEILASVKTDKTSTKTNTLNWEHTPR